MAACVPSDQEDETGAWRQSWHFVHEHDQPPETIQEEQEVNYDSPPECSEDSKQSDSHSEMPEQECLEHPVDDALVPLHVDVEETGPAASQDIVDLHGGRTLMMLCEQIFPHVRNEDVKINFKLRAMCYVYFMSN